MCCKKKSFVIDPLTVKVLLRLQLSKLNQTIVTIFNSFLLISDATQRDRIKSKHAWPSCNVSITRLVIPQFNLLNHIYEHDIDI